MAWQQRGGYGNNYLSARPPGPPGPPGPPRSSGPPGPPPPPPPPDDGYREQANASKYQDLYSRISATDDSLIRPPQQYDASGDGYEVSSNFDGSLIGGVEDNGTDAAQTYQDDSQIGNDDSTSASYPADGYGQGSYREGGSYDAAADNGSKTDYPRESYGAAYEPYTNSTSTYGTDNAYQQESQYDDSEQYQQYREPSHLKSGSAYEESYG